MNKPAKPLQSNAFLSWLSAELSERMNDKLSLVKIIPSSALEIMPRLGHGLRLLRHNYPKAKLLATPAEVGGLLNLLKNIFGKGVPSYTPVTFEPDQQLAIKDAQVELIWASTWLFAHDSAWEEDLKEWRRVLKVDGLLMFSYLGPDTGQELRGLPNLKAVWGVDMHDMGDALVKSGFADPVMDMEYITLEYDNAELLFKDAVELGFGVSEQINGLGVDGFTNPLQLTLEVVYGHAWTPKQRLSRSTMGVATIDIDQIVRQKT